jgi:hypothetical protein
MSTIMKAMFFLVIHYKFFKNMYGKKLKNNYLSENEHLFI